MEILVRAGVQHVRGSGRDPICGMSVTLCMNLRM